MRRHPRFTRLKFGSDSWQEYESDLLTDGALQFLIALQDRYAGRIRAIRALEAEEQARIDAGEKGVYSFQDDPISCAIRYGDWRVAPQAISEIRKQPGVILVSPADPVMIVKAITTEKRYFVQPIANMIDFEDAFHLDFRKVLQGHRTLLQARRGSVRVEESLPSGAISILEYHAATDPLHLIRVRVNGLNTPPVEEIRIDGKPLERCLLDFGLHFYHNIRAGKGEEMGPNYVLPKMDAIKAALWRDIFEFSEAVGQVSSKTIKASAIVETIKGDFQIHEMAFALAGGREEEARRLALGESIIFKNSYLEAFCSGRHDRVFDLIKTFHADRKKIFPENRFTGIDDIGARQSWDEIVAVARLRGFVPVGGMVVALTSDPETRELALKITTESLAKEHERGSVQAWEAMPDTTDSAMAILRKSVGDEKIWFEYLESFTLAKFSQRARRIAKLEKIATKKLLTLPKGTVSEEAVVRNIHQAIEYLEAWLRGYGVIPYRPKGNVARPIMMQNMATAERARAELWTWIRHGAPLIDTGKRLTKERFEELVDAALEEMRSAMQAGFVPKGKMSPPSFEAGCYREAAHLLKKVVLQEEFIDTIKYPLIKKYKAVQKRRRLSQNAHDRHS